MEQIRQVEDPAGGFMKVPMIVLCMVIVLLGMFSTPLVSYFEKIAAGLL